jgi:hypothetical protein
MVDEALVVFMAVVCIPPANVEVAVEVEVITPVVKRPIEDEAKNESTILPMFAKKDVVVAFVVVELSAINVVEAKKAV